MVVSDVVGAGEEGSLLWLVGACWLNLLPDNPVYLLAVGLVSKLEQGGARVIAATHL